MWARKDLRELMRQRRARGSRGSAELRRVFRTNYQGEFSGGRCSLLEVGMQESKGKALFAQVDVRVDIVTVVFNPGLSCE